MSRAPARSREAMAVRMTSAGSRPASSAARRVRNSHRAWCDRRLPVAGRERGQDQVAVAVVAGGCGFGGPDRVQDGQVVGVGQVALPDRGGGQLGAVAAQDVGEHGDRLPRVGAAPPPVHWPGRGGTPRVRAVRVRTCSSSRAGRVLVCGSAGRAGVVNTNTRLASVPRVIAGYSHWRSSPPVTTGSRCGPCRPPMPGDRVGEIPRLVVGVPERPVGELPRPVGPARGDGGPRRRRR